MIIKNNIILLIKKKSSMSRLNTTLCIPRMESIIPVKYILQKLGQTKWGKIQKIIEIPLKSDENYKRILVKMVWNDDNPDVVKIRDKLNGGEKINLVYEMPYFWKISLANSVHP